MTRYLRALTLTLAGLLAAAPLAAQVSTTTSIQPNGFLTTNGQAIVVQVGGVTRPAGGWATLSVQVSGTWTGTLTFERTIDAVTYQSVYGTPTNSTTAVTTVTGNGQWVVAVPGASLFQVRATAPMTGTAVIYIRGTASGGAGSSGGGGGGGGTTPTGPAGTPNAEVVSVQGITGGTPQDVTCVSGCGGGTTDTDDGSIAYAQSIGLTGALNYVSSGSAWARLTFGPAGTASPQVFTMQGIAAMTPILATLTGTNALPTGAATASAQASQLTQETTAATNTGTTATQTTAINGKLPAAAAMADGVANPTLSAIQSYNMCFNGTTHDRCRTIAINCQDPTLTTSVPIAVATSGNNEIVALTSLNLIYVCGWHFTVAGDVAAQWVYGTATNCATGETDITGPEGYLAGGGIAIPNGGAVQFKTPASQALCLELSASVAVNGMLTYIKQ